MIKFTTIHLTIVVVLAAIILFDQVQSMSSYNGGNQYQGTSNAYDDNYSSDAHNDESSGAYNDGYTGEERPKIKLNIGLHIPAMKITMPKKLLPKITVRAKVRQPHKPSVMYVPEVQIDKTDQLPGPEGSFKTPTVGGSNNNNNYSHESPNGYDTNIYSGSYDNQNNNNNNINHNNNYAYQQPAAQISTMSYQDRGFADSKHLSNNYYASSLPQRDIYRPSGSNGAYQHAQGPYQQRNLQYNQYSGPNYHTQAQAMNNYFNQVGYQQQPAAENYQQQGYNNLRQYNENRDAYRYYQPYI